MQTIQKTMAKEDLDKLGAQACHRWERVTKLANGSEHCAMENKRAHVKTTMDE